MGSIIAKENLRVGLKAKDWTDAIRLSGAVLEEAGSIEHAYTAVHKEDLALVTLAQPVSFGSPNDPVRLILCVACTDRESHVRALSAVAEALSSDGVMEKLTNAASVDEMDRILNS